MEAKKTTKANLEKQKPMFLKIGVFLSLALVLFAFEWKTFSGSNEIISKGDGYFIPEDLYVKPIKPTPPEKQINQKQINQTVFKVVENDIKTNFIFSTEIDTSTYLYPTPEPPKEIEVKDDIIIRVAEIMPLFPGGENELFTFIHSNIKYPRESIEINNQGTVYVTFVVEKDGRLSNFSVLRGIDQFCDKEALRVVSEMPKWNPGFQGGKAVRVQFVLPIKFELR